MNINLYIRNKIWYEFKYDLAFEPKLALREWEVLQAGWPQRSPEEALQIRLNQYKGVQTPWPIMKFRTFCKNYRELRVGELVTVTRIK